MGTGKLKASILSELSQPDTVSVERPLPRRMPGSPSGGPLITQVDLEMGQENKVHTETPISRGRNVATFVDTQAKRDEQEAYDKAIWDQKREIPYTI